MIKFNPQLKIELTILNPDGSEEPMTVPVMEDIDLRNYKGNLPVFCDVSISRSMDSNQDKATITMHNSPFFEVIIKDYYALIEEMRDQMWRVRIWQWYSNSEDATDPEYEPYFIGDMNADFTTTPSGITDNQITLTANSHYRSNTFGKLRRDYLAETPYRDIADDMFIFMTDEMGYLPHIVRDEDDVLRDRFLIGSQSINRNVGECLNDICNTHDFTWTVHNNTPALIKKDQFYDPEELPIPDSQIPVPLVIATTGKNSMNSYGLRTIKTTAFADNELFPGRFILLTDIPQTLDGQFLEARIDKVNAKFSNYQANEMALECSVVSNGRVVLPEKSEKIGSRGLV